MADACYPLSGCALQLPTSSRSYAGRTPDTRNVRNGSKADTRPMSAMGGKLTPVCHYARRRKRGVSMPTFCR